MYTNKRNFTQVVHSSALRPINTHNYSQPRRHHDLGKKSFIGVK